MRLSPTTTQRMAVVFMWALAAITLAASVLMQIVTNLENDVGYTERGGETGTRVGLPRATANGWLRIDAVKKAVLLAIVTAWIVAMPLLRHAGWPVAAMGIGATLAAYSYMGGPRPIAYTPFGELMVFLFFGIVAVCGTFYVQTGTLRAEAMIAAAATGLLASAVLLVNNTRDRDHDAGTGRRTLAVVLGRDGSMRVLALLLFLPFLLTTALALEASSAWFALPLAALPVAWRLHRDVARTGSGPAMNTLLFRTVKLEVAFGALLTTGALAYTWA